MMKDILIKNGEWRIVNGDFVIDKSDLQNIDNIIVSHRGEWKEHPLIGFVISNYLAGEGDEVEFSRDLQEQLDLDDYTEVTIDVSGGINQLKIKY